MTSKLNVIINPVRRWYSTDKEIIEPPTDTKVYFTFDEGNEITTVFLGLGLTVDTNYAYCEVR